MNRTPYPQVYTYLGYTVDGQDASTGLDWRISKGDEWICSLPTKRECKMWIETETNKGLLS